MPLARVGPPAAVAVFLHAALVAAYLAPHGGDLSALVCVDRSAVGRAPFEHVTRGFATGGYDGQFYYAIARAPWRRHDAGIDGPAARHLRVLYPALGWACSGGDPRLLPAALPAVNLAAVGGLAALGAACALRRGLSPWWGVTLPFACNVGLGALRDLTDPVAAFVLCGLLVAWDWRRPPLVLGLCAAAAAFAREQNVAVVALLLGTAAWRRRPREAVALGGALAAWAA